MTIKFYGGFMKSALLFLCALGLANVAFAQCPNLEGTYIVEKYSGANDLEYKITQSENNGVTHYDVTRTYIGPNHFIIKADGITYPDGGTNNGDTWLYESTSFCVNNTVEWQQNLSVSFNNGQQEVDNYRNVYKLNSDNNLEITFENEFRKPGRSVSSREVQVIKRADP